MRRAFALEVKYELLKLLRTPAYCVFTLAFPLMFYIFFGLIMSQSFPGGAALPRYLIGTYGTFGVVGIALFAFGVGIAVERSLGWLELKQASPMMPLAYVGAKALASAVFCVMLTLALFLLGFLFGGLRLSLEQFVLLELTLVLGSVPFCVLGLAVGYFVHAQSASAVMNTLYLPMAFISGLWVPIQGLPGWVQSAAPALPPYHLAQLALSILEMPSSGSASGHIGALAAFTVMFGGLAWLGQTRNRETI